MNSTNNDANQNGRPFGAQESVRSRNDLLDFHVNPNGRYEQKKDNIEKEIHPFGAQITKSANGNYIDMIANPKKAAKFSPEIHGDEKTIQPFGAHYVKPENTDHIDRLARPD